MYNKKKTRLPIAEHKDAFMRMLDNTNCLILVGETGSGKTTQVPQWCVEYLQNKRDSSSITIKSSKVACTQPRRVAAMSVAERVAREMNVELGQEVGYSVRFNSKVSQNTVLKYLTDGMILREAILDEYLNQYGIIVLDEVHERSLQTEILLGIVKKILKKRSSDPSLQIIKIVVMSATMNVKLFKRFFDAPILSIKGRQHEVTNLFAEFKQSDYITAALITVFQIHRTSNEKGDILVFCTGQDEIEASINLCRRAIKQAPCNSFQNLRPFPLYASLPASHQMRIFAKYGNLTIEENGNQPSISRRVIFATNVAETSVTIPNIRYVIDTGKVKYRTYCPQTGIESLKVVTISKAQAKQRAGRAGRVSSGTCYRLFTSEEFDQMKDQLEPEIKRCNLESVIFLMISIGIKNIGRFEFLETPDESRMESAIKHLLSLKAIRACEPKVNGFNHQQNGYSKHNDITNHLLVKDYELTTLGKKLSTFPLDPRMSRILLAADELGCLDEAIIVISLMYIDTLFFIPADKQELAEAILEKFSTNEGDLIMYLKVYKAFHKALIMKRSSIKLWCNQHFINKKNLKLAVEVKKQLARLCSSIGLKPSSCGQNTEKLRRALTYGLFDNVATMWNGKYITRDKREISIHPSSCLFKAKPECLMYCELVETSKCFMRKLTTVDKHWITSLIRPSQN